jgi:hypothetical protein
MLGCVQAGDFDRTSTRYDHHGMELRFDRGVLQRPVRKDGTLVLEGHAARVHRPGDPLRYPHGNEYRDDGELRALVGQLKGIPVTLGHPRGLISEGAPARVVGRVDAAWLDGEHAAVTATITDRNAIDEIMAGTKELSLGYSTDVDGAGYQRGSRADHLAVVSSARCGASCSLRTDENTACACGCSGEIDRAGSRGESVRMAEKTDKQRADELETTVATLNAEVKRLEALIASGAHAAESEALRAAVARADAAEAKVAQLDEVLEKRADERAKLRTEAAAFVGAAVRLDGMTERQIHEVVIKRLDASLNIASENDDQVRGRYNTLTALATRNAESQRHISQVLSRTAATERKDDAPSHEDVENSRWKKTLSKGRDAAAEGR